MREGRGGLDQGRPRHTTLGTGFLEIANIPYSKLPVTCTCE